MASRHGYSIDHGACYTKTFLLAECGETERCGDMSDRMRSPVLAGVVSERLGLDLGQGRLLPLGPRL